MCAQPSHNNIIMWVEVIYRHMHATPGDISMLDANAVMWDMWSREL